MRTSTGASRGQGPHPSHKEQDTAADIPLAGRGPQAHPIFSLIPPGPQKAACDSEGQEVWRAAVHGVAESDKTDLATEQESCHFTQLGECPAPYEV